MISERQINRRAAWSTAIALVLTGVFALTVAVLRRDEITFAAVNKQAKYKTVQWRGVCDTVLLGDSRVEIGLSPDDMEAQLPGATVRNFGFGGVAMTADYITSATKTLRDEAPVRRVVVGVTPRMFLASSEAYNNFIEANRAYGEDRKTGSRLSLWTETGPFRPANPEGILDALEREDEDDEPKKKTAVWTNYPNGWSSVSTDTPKPQTKLESYEELFAAEQVEAVLVEQFLAQVVAWREQGIRVYATRVAVTPELYALENRASGLSPASFIERFEQAGGVWFDFPMTYPTFDGTHLLESGARAFSGDLARRIAEYEASQPVEPSPTTDESDIVTPHE
jgi:hypothetical protein